MQTRAKILARSWVSAVLDERVCGNSIIIELMSGYDFCDDPGSGTRGFYTWDEAERGTRANAVVETTHN